MYRKCRAKTYPFTTQFRVLMTLTETTLENFILKAENACNQLFLLSPHCFLPYQRQKSSFNPFPNKPCFSCVCSTSLLKTLCLWGKEKLLVASNFSFSHIVFYPIGELSAIFNKFEIVVCKLFQFKKV